MDFCHNNDSPALDFTSLLNEYYNIDLNKQNELLPVSILTGETNVHLTLNFIQSSPFIQQVPNDGHPEEITSSTQLPVQQSEQPTSDISPTPAVSTYPGKSGLHFYTDLNEPSASTSHRHLNIELNEPFVESDEEDIN